MKTIIVAKQTLKFDDENTKHFDEIRKLFGKHKIKATYIDQSDD